MKKITVTCALLLLVSCKHTMDITPTSGDSSPIIISDGSIHLKHGKPDREFSKRNKKSAEISFANYTPRAVGFLCDPSAYQPTGTPCGSAPTCVPGTTTNAAACKVDTTATSWVLSLCDDPGPCASKAALTVTGVAGGATMTIDSKKNDFAFTKARPNVNAELIHAGADALQSATLVSGGKSYAFDCPPGQACLTIAYDCDSGCK
jgi:hypothetical protein